MYLFLIYIYMYIVIAIYIYIKIFFHLKIIMYYNLFMNFLFLKISNFVNLNQPQELFYYWVLILFILELFNENIEMIIQSFKRN